MKTRDFDEAKALAFEVDQKITAAKTLSKKQTKAEALLAERISALPEDLRIIILDAGGFEQLVREHEHTKDVLKWVDWDGIADSPNPTELGTTIAQAEHAAHRHQMELRHDQEARTLKALGKLTTKIYPDIKMRNMWFTLTVEPQSKASA
ncbi:MAG: hypothetical protein AAGA71_21140 [Pseudomonadota bacterium]